MGCISSTTACIISSRPNVDHDSKVRATLQSHGGRVFRVTAGQLKTVEEVVALRELVAEALGI